MEESRKRGRPPGRRYEKRFHFACSTVMYDSLLAVARLANEDATEVARRMIERQLPYFLHYTSVHKKLPNGE